MTTSADDSDNYDSCLVLQEESGWKKDKSKVEKRKWKNAPKAVRVVTLLLLFRCAVKWAESSVAMPTDFTLFKATALATLSRYFQRPAY